MLQLQIRKTLDGHVVARRSDGQPLTQEDREQVRRMAEADDSPAPWIVEEVKNEVTGQLKATKICSPLLECHLWILHDPEFYPPNSDAVFFADEIPLLRTKSIEEVREVLKVKLVFPRCRVVQ